MIANGEGTSHTLQATVPFDRPGAGSGFRVLLLACGRQHQKKLHRIATWIAQPKAIPILHWSFVTVRSLHNE